jgi:hypothetical protein
LNKELFIHSSVFNKIEIEEIKIMTSVVRYVTHTMDGDDNTPAVDSTGSDYQLVAFDITTTEGIAADADADVLEWEGSGTIKSILAISAKVIATGEMIPMGVVATNTHTLVTIDPAGKIINVAVLAGGVAIPANTTICLLLVIGNY